MKVPITHCPGAPAAFAGKLSVSDVLRRRVTVSARKLPEIPAVVNRDPDQVIVANRESVQGDGETAALIYSPRNNGQCNPRSSP